MDIERHLISKVVAEGDLLPAMEASITPAFFVDEESREVFRFLLEHRAKYGRTATAQALKRNYPTYRLVRAEEPTLFYIEEIRKAHKDRLLFDTLARAGTALDKGQVDAAMNHLASGLSRVNAEVSALADSDLWKTRQQRLQGYEMLKRLKGQLRGIPSGFPTLDEALSGFQPEQFITVIGEPKAGKSTLLLRLAMNANDAGYKVLFLSFEMSAEEQSARHDAMLAGINHRDLLAGRLSEEDETRLRDALAGSDDVPPFILSTDISSLTTVSGVSAKIEQHRPDIVFIDGVYLMEDEHGAEKNTPQAITNLTRDLKRLAQRSRIPVLGTTQVLHWKVNRRQGLRADAIGYSSSFAQDSDVIIGAESDPNDEHLKRLSIVLARSAPRREVTARWDWETSTFEELGADDDDEEEFE